MRKRKTLYLKGIEPKFLVYPTCTLHPVLIVLSWCCYKTYCQKTNAFGQQVSLVYRDVTHTFTSVIKNVTNVTVEHNMYFQLTAICGVRLIYLLSATVTTRVRCHTDASSSRNLVTREIMIWLRDWFIQISAANPICDCCTARRSRDTISRVVRDITDLICNS